MHYNSKLLIIGAGPVGLFTVFTAGMLGITNCHLLDSLNFAGGQCSALYPEKYIYDIPGIPKIKAKDLTDNLIQQVARFQPNYHFNQIAESLKIDNNKFTVRTSSNDVFTTDGIIIAGGSGMFAPNKPPLENIEDFENKSIFYAVDSYDKFKNKIVMIAGGGDSAIDFALILGENIAKQVIIVHRRDNFRCAPDSLKQIHELIKKGRIKLITPCQLNSLQGENGQLKSVTISNIKDGDLQNIEVDFLLPFFGLKMNLGHLKNWGLELWENRQIKVDLPNCQTNIPKIYAVGDIAGFNKKIKLIATGFAETNYACHDFYQKLHPEIPLHVKHSTDMFKD